MDKTILDELQVKNSENLSDSHFKRNTALGMNRDLDKLKINDDFSNEDVIVDEYTSKITNSYIELNDVVKQKDKYKGSKHNTSEVNLSSLTLNNK